MERLFVLLSGLSGALTVALGAFGAHALRGRLRTEALATFETGVRYEMYHTLALLTVALVMRLAGPQGLLIAAGWLFIAGIALFSGSLYLLALTRKRWLGAITPFGGLAFVVGWLCLALAAVGLR